MGLFPSKENHPQTAAQPALRESAFGQIQPGSLHPCRRTPPRRPPFPPCSRWDSGYVAEPTHPAFRGPFPKAPLKQGGVTAGDGGCLSSPSSPTKQRGALSFSCPIVSWLSKTPF